MAKSGQLGRCLERIPNRRAELHRLKFRLITYIVGATRFEARASETIIHQKDRTHPLPVDEKSEEYLGCLVASLSTDSFTASEKSTKSSRDEFS